MLSDVLVPIHRAGWPFVGGALVCAAILFPFWPLLGWAGLATALFCVYFFRDPERITPTRPGLVVSPADGIVSAVAPSPPPPELDMGAQPLVRVSVFLNIFDVHVNRVPTDGTVTAMAYRKGKFINAARDKASEDNERQSVLLTLADGRRIALVQIAGLIARRIVCALNPGETVRGGARFGLIRFGSRVDLYLPEGVAPLVAPGQRMIGGETVIADLNNEEGPRSGEAR